MLFLTLTVLRNCVVSRLYQCCTPFLLRFQAERLDIEEKYVSLQEEAAGKTRKIKRVWSMLQATKREVS